MTMRLDIVTNDAGELVRREHARDSGTNALMSVYKLAKLAQVHNLTNQAFLQQLEQTVSIINDYCLRAGTHLNILFAHRAAFISGQLLKGSKNVYQLATELAEMFEWLGGSELIMQRDISRDEMLSFAEEISRSMRSSQGSFRSPTPKIRLRKVTDAARLRGIEVEQLDLEARIRRTYASAVVVLRRFFEDLQASRYMLPRRIKRVAQSLVDLSDGTTPAYLGVTEVRNANHDEAGRAVNSAILAVAIAREVTQDRVTLAQVAMAAMMHDVARPRAFALSVASAGEFAPMMTSLSEEQEDRLAAGTAAVLTALGRVNEPSITRTVVAYEAQWLRRAQWLGALYRGRRPPTVHARIMRIARRYNDLLTPEPGLPPPTTDFAVATLSEELTDQTDRTVLRMLVSALGLVPMGTVLQLSTGEVAEVTRGASGALEKPRVRIVMDARGAVVQGPEVDLGKPARGEPPRQITRVVSIEGWKKGLEGFERKDGGAGSGSDYPPPPEAAPPAAPAASAWSPAQEARAPVQEAPRPTRVPIELAPVEPAPSALRPQPSYSGWVEQPPETAPFDSSGSGVSASGVSASGVSGVSASGVSGVSTVGTSPSRVAEAMGSEFKQASAPARPLPEDVPTAAAPIPKKQSRRATSAPSIPDRLRPEGVEPTAEGVLSATPLAHVLVYMLDHSLTGTVIFFERDYEHAVFFVAGVPAKVKLAYGGLRLGEALVRLGLLDSAAIDDLVKGARESGFLFGEYISGKGLVSQGSVALGLELQLLENLAMLTNLPPEATYSYFYNVNSLEHWGAGELSLQGPLNAVLTAVRQWKDRNRIRATLTRIAKHPLTFFEEADFESLVLTSEEEAVMALLRTETLTFTELLERKVAPEESVNALVYTFAVTRQFAFKGQKKGPMAARGTRPAPPVPSPKEQVPVAAKPTESAKASRPVLKEQVVAKPAPPREPVREAVAPRESGAPSSAPHPSLAPPSGGARPLPSAPPGARRPLIRPIRPAGSPPAKAEPPRPVPPAGDLRGASAPPQQQQQRPAAPSMRAAQAPPPMDDGDDEKTAIAPARTDFSALRAMQAQSRAPRVEVPASPTAFASAGPRAGSGGGVALDLEVEIPDEGMADAERALEAMTDFRLAEAALQRGDLSSAEALAEKALEGDPGQSEYRALLVWIRSQGHPDTIEQAIGEFEQLISDDPVNERALFYRGKLLKALGRSIDALASFEDVLALNPQHREAGAEVRGLRARR